MGKVRILTFYQSRMCSVVMRAGCKPGTSGDGKPDPIAVWLFLLRTLSPNFVTGFIINVLFSKR